MGDHEPDAAPAVAIGRSRIEAGADAGRSTEGEVLGRTAAAVIDSGQPSAEQAASAEGRSPGLDEPVARARVATQPAEQASARDAVTGASAPAVASEAREAGRAPAQGGSGRATSGSAPTDSGSPDVPPAVLPDRLAGVGDPALEGGLGMRDAAGPEPRAQEAGAGWGDFGVTMLRRSIDRLFGWSRDQPAEPPAPAPAPAEGAGAAAVAGRDDRAPASAEGAPGQLRSKSEASIRQAVRAMVALEEVEPAAGPADAAGEPDQTLEPAAPAFDIVRVEPSGSAVLAGRAAPGAEVEVRAGDEVIDRVKADRSGAWVSTPATPIPAGDQTLSLAALKDDGTVLRSEDVVVVAIRDSQPPSAPSGVATPEPPPPQPPTRVVAEAPPPQPAEIVPAVAPAKPLAVLLPARGKGRILQAPGRIGSNGELALNVLDYDRSGRVELTGEAPPGAPIRIYVDNEAAAEVVAAGSGAWTAALEDRLGPGTYTLRLDQLDAAGRPVARLETPFTRVDRPPRDGDVEVDYVIVQPGNSLWRIARRLTGRGMTYVHIFDANRTQIRDPDLIYPGQVFEVPAGFGSAG